MDWDWRRFSWNSTFPENQDELGDFGAQLGGLKRKEAPPSPTMADSKLKSNDSKDSSASKKLCPLKGSQKLTCLADGCKSNLNNCKDYHRRHRVCEHHSKTPVVIIRGEEKRFCQQCSRFHSLAEFDEVKRSCRKRLDGHNRRRRKPQPESIYMSSKDFLSINFKGPRILKFSDPETYESMWPSFSKTEAQATTIHNRHQWMQINDRQIPSKLSSAYYALNGEGGGGVGGGGDKHFSSPLLKTGLKHGSHQIVPNFPACQTLPITITSPESGWETHKVPSDAGPPLPLDSGGALYLLSTYPTGQVSDIGLSCLVQPNATHPPDPPDRISIFDPNKTGIPCTETMMIHMGETDHGLFECEVSPKLPLSWEQEKYKVLECDMKQARQVNAILESEAHTFP